MLRQTRSPIFFTPFKLPPKSQINPNGSRRIPVTTPTPISGEVGGLYGVSIQYSDEMSRGSTYAERMAKSTYSLRLEENRTMYPMSPYREGEFDPRYLPTPFPDPMKNRPLLEVGEPDDIPREMKIPVIFLCDVKQDVSGFYKGAHPGNNHVFGAVNDSTLNGNNISNNNNKNKNSNQQGEDGLENDEENDEVSSLSGEEEGGDSSSNNSNSSDAAAGISNLKIATKSSNSHEEESMIQARKYETHYVNQSFMRRKLQPQRLAVFATKENYRLLGLPERDLKIHAEIPRNRDEYEKLRAKQLWDNERWRFSFEMLFRKYDQGPPELVDDEADDWDGNEEVLVSGGGAGGDGKGGKGGKVGPAIKRKARKIKLF